MILALEPTFPMSTWWKLPDARSILIEILTKFLASCVGFGPRVGDLPTISPLYPLYIPYIVTIVWPKFMETLHGPNSTFQPEFAHLRGTKWLQYLCVVTTCHHCNTGWIYHIYTNSLMKIVSPCCDASSPLPYLLLVYCIHMFVKSEANLGLLHWNFLIH